MPEVTSPMPQSKPQPRYGIVYRMDHPGGVQSCALAVIKGLNQKGIIPDILWDQEPDRHLLEKSSAKAGFKRLNFPVPTRFIDRFPESIRYLLHIPNLIRNNQNNLKDYSFYFIFDNGFLVCDGTPHIRYLSGPPLLPQLEVIPPGIKGIPYRFFKFLYQQIFSKKYPIYEYHRNSNYVINSHYTAELFYQAHEVHLPVVHPPINISGRGYSTDDISRRDTITFFSRIVDYKRPEMFVDLVKRTPSIRAVLMGAVPSHRMSFFMELQDYAKNIGAHQVEFLANPSNQRVKDELARTKFFVFPARNEHFGMTTVEAIASGAIPYVHNSGGQREIVIEDRLRFEDEEYFDKFQNLQSCSYTDLNDLRARLFSHIQQYSEEAYIDKMLAFSSDLAAGKQ